MKKIRPSNKISPLILDDENNKRDHLEMSENDSETEQENDETSSIRKKTYQKLGKQSKQNVQKINEKPISYGPDSHCTKILSSIDFTDESKISKW
jgi:hypothetical protein